MASQSRSVAAQARPPPISAKSKKKKKSSGGARSRSSAPVSDLASLSRRPRPSAQPALSSSQSRVSSVSSLSSTSAAPGGIRLKEWDPKTPYLNELRAIEKIPLQYAKYLQQTSEWGTSPAFYLDVSELFFRQKEATLGVRILTNILELSIEDHQLLRIVGYKLSQAGMKFLAKDVFEKVLQMRPDEPQSYRDLALVLQRIGKRHYQRAADLLWKVVKGKWDSRFEEIELTVLMELNRLLAVAEHHQVPISMPEEYHKKHLDGNLTCDIRISLAWDTDQTDIDLHVIEPTKEEVYYGHKNSRNGGLISRDFRNGYGPEEYMIRYALEGRYAIRAKYFASHQQKLAGGTTAMASVFVNWGNPEEEEEEILTIRLQSNRDITDIGAIRYEFCEEDE